MINNGRSENHDAAKDANSGGNGRSAAVAICTCDAIDDIKSALKKSKESYAALIIITARDARIHEVGAAAAVICGTVAITS